MKPKKCALISTPRAGTHYLRMTLDNHPKIGWAGEFFRPDSKYRNSPLYKEHFEIKDYIYDNTITPFVGKFSYVGFVWHLTLNSDLPFSKIDKFILLERKYKLAQFVSLKIATKTKVWRDKETKEKVEVLPKNLFNFIDRQTKLYEDFKSLNLDYKKVYYEDLCKDFDKTINSIQDYLNVERFELDPAMLQKQEKRPLREVIKNYEEVKLYDGFYKI
tara:strand:- start:22 stop:672 length:651 start_codon:yes stop_codon:yes gene_type:complete